jgi:hypothetical protein
MSAEKNKNVLLDVEKAKLEAKMTEQRLACQWVFENGECPVYLSDFDKRGMSLDVLGRSAIGEFILDS